MVPPGAKAVPHGGGARVSDPGPGRGRRFLQPVDRLPEGSVGGAVGFWDGGGLHGPPVHFLSLLVCEGKSRRIESGVQRRNSGGTNATRDRHQPRRSRMSSDKREKPKPSAESRPELK